MFTTIDYKIMGPKCRRRDAAFATVVELRECALGLPFHRVGQIVELSGKECNPGDNREISDRHTLACHGRAPDPQCDSLLIRACKIIAFSTVPAPGSGPAYFGFARYPKFITTDRGTCREKKWRTSLEGWSWTGHFETMNAHDMVYGGLGNYLRGYLTVINMLDIANDLGVLRDVCDDCGYWETRNFDHLISRMRARGCFFEDVQSISDMPPNLSWLRDFRGELT